MQLSPPGLHLSHLPSYVVTAASDLDLFRPSQGLEQRHEPADRAAPSFLPEAQVQGRGAARWATL